MERMYFFDIDGTLAYPGEPVTKEVSTPLLKLIRVVGHENVVFVTGTPLEKAKWQLGDKILNTGITLFASMGGVAMKRNPKTHAEKTTPRRPCWADVKSLRELGDVDLTDRNFLKAWNLLQEKYRGLRNDLSFLADIMTGTPNKTFQICTLDQVSTWNQGKVEKDFIDETRMGMVTFRTVADGATTTTRDIYKDWENGKPSPPAHPLRKQIANFLRHRHPDFFFTVSGSTSIDILWKKGEGTSVFGQKDEVLTFLGDRINGKKLIFVADETQSNSDGIGNDHLLAEAILRRQGVVYTVEKPLASKEPSNDTVQFLESQIILAQK